MIIFFFKKKKRQKKESEDAEYRYHVNILNVSIGFDRMGISLFCWPGFSVPGISIHEHSSEESLYPGTGVVL